MLKSFSRKYRTKYSYRLSQPWAVKALQRDNYLCQDCKQEKLNIVIHHIDESRKTGKLNNNLDNLISLCKQCHAKTHGLILKFPNPKFYIIKKFRRQQKTYQEIGDYLGISYQRVSQIFKKYQNVF